MDWRFFQFRKALLARLKFQPSGVIGPCIAIGLLIAFFCILIDKRDPGVIAGYFGFLTKVVFCCAMGYSAWNIRKKTSTFHTLHIIVLIACIVFTGLYFIREMKKETSVFRNWVVVHTGSFRSGWWESPEFLMENIESIETLGKNEKGAVSMYGAVIMRKYNDNVGFMKVYVEPYRDDFNFEKARDNSNKYYRYLYKKALAEAPDNPHFLTQALYMQHEKWADIFVDTLERYPHYPYNAYIAYHLAHTSNLQFNDKLKYVRLYEGLVGKYLRKTKDDRPGYKRFPAVVNDINYKKKRDGLHFDLGPNEKIILEGLNFFNSDRVKIGLYVHVADGYIKGTVIINGDKDSNGLDCIAESFDSYRLFEATSPEGAQSAHIVLESGDDGAHVIIRDYYPMVENPRFYRDTSAYFFVPALKRMVGGLSELLIF
ncbi:hypothetical protein ACFL47_01135 [Candidatus Latescibacterota bacterium]